MSIAINGIEELVRKMDTISNVLDVIEPPMMQGGERLHSYMAVYPPQPPRSRYIRGYGFPGHPTSEHLGQSWTTKRERSPNSLTIRIGNDTSYGPLVQSARFQARIHKRTGWRTDEMAIRNNEAAIITDVKQAVDEALAK